MNAQTLRTEVARYLNGELSLRSFQEWFIPEAWEVSGRGWAEELALVSEIELRLAEYTNGHLSQPELDEALRYVLSGLSTAHQAQAPFMASIMGAHFIVVNGSSSARQQSPSTVSWPTSASVGTRSSGARA